MGREADVPWFEANRKRLARDFPGQWIVVHHGEMVQAFGTDEEAVVFAVSRFGVDSASVFQAVDPDPLLFVG